MYLLVSFVFFVVIVVLCVYLLRALKMPEPWNTVVVIVFVILALLVAWNYLPAASHRFGATLPRVQRV